MKELILVKYGEMVLKGLNKKSFEESLQEVQEIITRIEEGKLPLEDSVKQFEEGMKTLAALDEELKEMNRRLTVLQNDIALALGAAWMAVPGLAFYVRKDGHVTGNMYEGSTEIPVILDSSMELTDEQVDEAINRWIEFSVKFGVSGVFDAGIPGDPKFHGKVYKRLCELDRAGKLPIYIDGCYVIASYREVEEGLRELKRFQREYNTEHLKVHTLKIFVDGTLKLHTAAMVDPYADTPEKGITALTKEEFAELIRHL